MVSGRRPSKTRGFLRFSKRPHNPLRTLGWSTFENSWFFAIFKSPVRPSADFGLVDLRKLVVLCDFQIARATLCGLWAGRPSKTRCFLRISNRPRDPLRTLGWSTFENSWFFAIFNSPARPFWAGRPSKTRGFLRFSNRPRNPLRSLGWSTCENSWFFAISKSPARPSAQLRVVESLSLRRGTHFLAAVNPKPSRGFAPERARCELEAVAEPLGLLLKCFSQLFSLNFCYQTFYSKTLYSKLFSCKFEIPWIIVCD